MSKKFVRNITDTVIKGRNKEPLYTNTQNDLLSDGEDVAVRNNNEYHILTDNIKELIAGNEFIRIERVDKNTIKIYGSDVDLSEYAKKEYVNQKIDEIEIDLSDYLTIEDAENTYQTMKNFDLVMEDIYEKFETHATIEYVDDQINAINVELEDYTTKEYVDGEITKILDGLADYYTKSEVNNLLDDLDYVEEITATLPIRVVRTNNNISIRYNNNMESLLYTHTFNDEELKLIFSLTISSTGSDNKEFIFNIVNETDKWDVVTGTFLENTIIRVAYTFSSLEIFNKNKNRLYIPFQFRDNLNRIYITGTSEMLPNE